MKAEEIFKTWPELKDFAVQVSFPPSTILVNGAEGVSEGVLILSIDGEVISLQYMHPKYTVGGDSQLLAHVVGSEWVEDSDGFMIAST